MSVSLLARRHLLRSLRPAVRHVASAATSRVQLLTEADTYHKAVAEDRLTVVYFTASWCGPCQMISPVYEALAAEHEAAAFLKVDVDELPDVAEAASVTAMPTFHFVRQNRLLDTMVGADAAKLRDACEQYSVSA